MDGEVFSYEGGCGTCTTYRIHIEGDGSAPWPTSPRVGVQRFKLVLSRTQAAGEDDIELLQEKCVAWIKKAGKRGRLPAVATLLLRSR